jgi:AraC-like DNA-binding protein
LRLRAEAIAYHFLGLIIIKMSYSWHAVENIGPPFLIVDEATFVIPKDGRIDLPVNHFKFLFILEGTIEHEIAGVEERLTLKPGDILAAPVVSSHAYINPNKSKAQTLHLVRMFLDKDYLEKRSRRRRRSPEVDLTDYVLHHITKVAQISGGIDNEISDLIAALRREGANRSIGFRHNTRSICTELIVAVTRKLIDAKESSHHSVAIQSSSSTIVVGVKEYIIKHLSKEMTLGEIAWHVGKGEEHLARVFKRETGRTVFDYVREVRINHARTLIPNPSLTMSDIASQCGFNSLSFFSRTFRQLTGMSPTGYRQQMEAVHIPPAE